MSRRARPSSPSTAAELPGDMSKKNKLSTRRRQHKADLESEFALFAAMPSMPFISFQELAGTFGWWRPGAGGGIGPTNVK